MPDRGSTTRLIVYGVLFAVHAAAAILVGTGKAVFAVLMAVAVAVYGVTAEMLRRRRAE
jgi:hypothetical protein